MLLHFLEFDYILFHLALFAPYREHTTIKGYASYFRNLINLWDNNLLSPWAAKSGAYNSFFSLQFMLEHRPEQDNGELLCAQFVLTEPTSRIKINVRSSKCN